MTDDKLLAYIDATPELMSLLYDIDLMPEQARGTQYWGRMLTIAAHWQANFYIDHPPTDHCGFDRTASHSAGHYVCECGWEESSAVDATVPTVDHAPRVAGPDTAPEWTSKVLDALEITAEWANPDYGWTADEHTIFHALRELKRDLAEANARIKDLKSGIESANQRWLDERKAREEAETELNGANLACRMSFDRANAAEARAADMFERTKTAIDSVRDCILNGRGALEAVLDSDQTNAVLAEFDQIYDALQPEPEQGEEKT